MRKVKGRIRVAVVYQSKHKNESEWAVFFIKELLFPNLLITAIDFIFFHMSHIYDLKWGKLKKPKLSKDELMIHTPAPCCVPLYPRPHFIFFNNFSRNTRLISFFWSFVIGSYMAPFLILILLSMVLSFTKEGMFLVHQHLSATKSSISFTRHNGGHAGCQTHLGSTYYQFFLAQNVTICGNIYSVILGMSTN